MRIGKLHILLAGLSLAAANLNAALPVRACPISVTSRSYFLVEVRGEGDLTGTDCSTLTTKIRAYEGSFITTTPKTNDIVYILDAPPQGTASLNLSAGTGECAKRDNGDTDVDEFSVNNRDGRPTTYHGHTQVLVNNDRVMPPRFAPSAYIKANLKRNGVKFNRAYFLNDAGAGSATSKTVCKIADADAASGYRYFCRMCGDGKENDD